MYYVEKYEEGIWYFKTSPRGDWQEFSDHMNREKLIELSDKFCKE